MELANGDVGRPLNFPVMQSSKQEIFSMPRPGYSREYPDQTQIDIDEDCLGAEEKPPQRGYHPSSSMYGIVHPNYDTQPQILRCHQGYQLEREGSDFVPELCVPVYHEKCQDVCSECAGGRSAVPCEFPLPPQSCYVTHGDCRYQPNLRTTADGRAPESCESVELYPSVRLEPMMEIQSECYETRSVKSHHGSQCDLREFREWQDNRGSQESLRRLPPELEKHIKECRCTCDHLGYGNYKVRADCIDSNEKTLLDGPFAHISRSHSQCSADSSCSRREPSVVYTQLAYPDSPRSNTSSNNGCPIRKKVSGELSAKHWWMVGLVFLVAATAGVGVGVPLALRGDPANSLEKRLEIVRSVLAEVPLIDGHNDLPWNIRSFIHNQLEKLKFNESLKTVEPWGVSDWSHTDIPRLREGMVGGQFWVAYVPCKTQYLNAVQLTLEQIDVIKRVIHKYRQHLGLVTNSQDIMKVFKEGKIASLIGIEGGHGFSNSLGTLRMMYELGVRYLSLTHTCDTPWATASTTESKGESHALGYYGLNDFGKKVVREMNRLGMMVDLSHVSTQTMKDTLSTTKAPIIFSHSSARALCNDTRNVPDDVLQQVKLNRGIVMVSFFNNHVSCGGKANTTDVADHINHIRRVSGIDHVGIGADYDGINKTPEGLEDVSKYPMLIAELLKDPTWTIADIRKLVSENIIRVFSEVEKVRDDLQARGWLPNDEEIHPDYLRGKTNCTYFFDSKST